ncbi:MAG: imidazole glycerol phosphate synthase subunit HisH [Saprospiraceae bacterium]|nr:imidazole glycerol phosphate synthase subunit HisH [Saprospiraceae bacterium]
MIAIIKYGAGNTKSVMNALKRLNADFVLTDLESEIMQADKVIFPGVGHANHTMSVLKEKGLDTIIRKVKNPLLGICVGMQVLFEYSEEGETACLGIIEGKVRKFDSDQVIVPQIGWNTTQYKENSLFKGLDENPWFYSVHSYYAEIGDSTIATSSYGEVYTSAVQHSNFYGTQFHPEKSSSNGKILINNFLEL